MTLRAVSWRGVVAKPVFFRIGESGHEFVTVTPKPTPSKAAK